MIPPHVVLVGSPWAVLPPGVHAATLIEIKEQFVFNRRRRGQFGGLVEALGNLRGAGCQRAFLDGSFVTAKPQPGDYDACWDPDGVDVTLLDPVLLTFDDGRAAQKRKYLGEFFPSTVPADAAGKAFLEFFQVDRFTGDAKGILRIDLPQDPMLQRTVTS